MNAIISAIGIYLPNNYITNEQLVELNPDWDIEKLHKKINIKKRTIAKEGECVSDLAVKAAEKLFETNICLKSEIDALLLCTQTPDYLLPTTACIVQDRLGLLTSCASFDFNLGCSGYEYGLWLANSLIVSGQAKKILLITSEIYSHHISLYDKTVATIFGDAATASLIEASDNDSDSKIISFELGTNGKGADKLIVPAGGARLRCSSETAIMETDERGNRRSKDNLYMDGPDVFRFVIDTVPKCIKSILGKNNYTMEDINKVFLHQANGYILKHIRKRLKIDIEKAPEFFSEIGNTVSSTIPLVIYDTINKGKLHKGDLCLLMGFGVGYSWAATLIRWGDCLINA